MNARLMNLTDFLLARVAEDEHDAYHAQGILGMVSHWHEVETLRQRGLTRADARHVHHWSADRVLAECEIKRKLIGPLARDGDDLPWDDETPEQHQVRRDAEAAVWLRVVRLLALPYADHPDYDPEWRPRTSRSPSGRLNHEVSEAQQIPRLGTGPLLVAVPAVRSGVRRTRVARY